MRTRNRVIIELPRAEGTHISDRELVEMVRDDVAAYLNRPGGVSGCIVRAESTEEP